MDNLLKLLNENARLTLEELANLTASTADDVAARMDRLERAGILRGYKAIVDWEKAGSSKVSSIIEVKITPKYNFGFDEFAESVSKFPEVVNVYLMSGGYDLQIEVLAKDFRDIAMFVSKRLAPMESVLSTATHFILRKYKDHGVLLSDAGRDERGIIV